MLDNLVGLVLLVSLGSPDLVVLLESQDVKVIAVLEDLQGLPDSLEQTVARVPLVSRVILASRDSPDSLAFKVR